MPLKESLPQDLKDLIADSFTSAELVEFLDIPVEDLIEYITEEILGNLPEIYDELSIDIDDED